MQCSIVVYLVLLVVEINSVRLSGSHAGQLFSSGSPWDMPPFVVYRVFYLYEFIGFLPLWGHVSLNMVECTLDALLLDVVHMLRPKAEGKVLEFAAEHDGAVSALIQMDKTKLQQILINLVANAIKFTSEGNVRLQVARGGTDHLQFAVVDTGRGIEEEEKAAVFQAFQ